MTQRPESPLRELCRGVVTAPEPAHEHVRRERIAAHVLLVQRQLLRQRAARRRGAAAALAVLLSAAAGLLLWLRTEAEPVPSVQLLGGHVSMSREGVLAALPPGPLELAADARLVTREEEGATLQLSSQTELRVSPASELKLARRVTGRARAGLVEERVRLVSGRVALQVPKLGQRGKVLVETSDALVEVRGTRFSVSVVPRPPLAPFTEVAVREGRVLVRGPGGERTLGAGERWSSAEAAPAQAAVAKEALEPLAGELVPPAPAAAERAPARRARRAAEVHRSELAAQNRLLEAAELARKNGLRELALARLEELVQRHPGSEHAHSARVARLRLLRELGRAPEARAAAREYLELYPQGFARAEAERALSEQP